MARTEPSDQLDKIARKLAWDFAKCIGHSSDEECQTYVGKHVSIIRGYVKAFCDSAGLNLGYIRSMMVAAGVHHGTDICVSDITDVINDPLGRRRIPGIDVDTFCDHV